MNKKHKKDSKKKSTKDLREQEWSSLSPKEKKEVKEFQADCDQIVKELVANLNKKTTK